MSLTVTKGTKCPQCGKGDMEHRGYSWYCTVCGCEQKGFEVHGNFAPEQMGMFPRGNNNREENEDNGHETV